MCPVPAAPLVSSPRGQHGATVDAGRRDAPSGAYPVRRAALSTDARVQRSTPARTAILSRRRDKVTSIRDVCKVRQGKVKKEQS